MLENRDQTPDLGTSELFNIIENENLFLARAWAMEELAKRALIERSLLNRLLNTLGKNMAGKTRQGTPLGSLSAVILVNNADDDVLEKISVSASE